MTSPDVIVTKTPTGLVIKDKTSSKYEIFKGKLYIYLCSPVSDLVIVDLFDIRTTQLTLDIESGDYIPGIIDLDGDIECLFYDYCDRIMYLYSISKRQIIFSRSFDRDYCRHAQCGDVECKNEHWDIIKYCLVEDRDNPKIISYSEDKINFYNLLTGDYLYQIDVSSYKLESIILVDLKEEFIYIRYKSDITADYPTSYAMISSLDGKYLGGGPYHGTNYINFIKINKWNRYIMNIQGENEWYLSKKYISGSYYIWSYQKIHATSIMSRYRFDPFTGMIAYRVKNQITSSYEYYIINANIIVSDTYEWTIEKYRYAPENIKNVIITLTMIRTLCVETIVSLIPNELLFEIFNHL